jgi:hypothetical protein
MVDVTEKRPSAQEGIIEHHWRRYPFFARVFVKIRFTEIWKLLMYYDNNNNVDKKTITFELKL